MVPTREDLEVAAAHAFDVFLTTENPLWFWRSYEAYREIDRDPPEWILLVLDGIASRLIQVGQHTRRGERIEIRYPKDWKTAILNAFGFKLNRNGGSQSPFSKWTGSISDLSIATKVATMIEDGQLATNAVYLVASKHSLSESRVRRAWKNYEQVVRAYRKRRPVNNQLSS